jgi:hypothetical protein
VDQTIIAIPRSVSLDCPYAVCWGRVEGRAQTINRRFDSGLDGSGHLKKSVSKSRE